MKAVLPVLALAAITACATPGPAERSRLDILDEAFAARVSDPAGAAREFAAAGAGTTLERVRLRVWLEELQATGAGPSEWRRLLEARPPPAVEIAARIGLARALAAADRPGEAVAVLEASGASSRVQADAALLELASGPPRDAAGARLAVAAPATLHRLDPELENRVLASLSPQEWLERGRRWRENGQAARALAELEPLRLGGRWETRRRLELARCRIAVGSPQRALRVLPAASRDPEVLLLRAAAGRRLAWQRFPRRTADRAFRDCLREASAAAAAGAEQASADEMILECGTEADALERALAAWRRLAARGWEDERREWLGRRLGIALARAGGDPSVALALAAELPAQRRCLEFWAAVAEGGGGHGRLRRLSEAPFADIYGLWARGLLGVAPPRGVGIAPELATYPPPPGVQWLLERDAALEAADQWRWIGDVRGALPGEGLAAAELETRLGRQGAAIRWLVATFPDLGTVAMDRTPANAVRAYLPLRWQAALASAAADSGLDPWLLAAVARQESSFVAGARSPRGALGVLQLLPGTARGHARALGLGVHPDLFDPEANLRLGARELARLLARFGAVEPALAAYNAGEARVAAWWLRWPDPRRFTEEIPIPESYNYVRRVTYLAEAYRLVYEEEWRDRR